MMRKPKKRGALGYLHHKGYFYKMRFNSVHEHRTFAHSNVHLRVARLWGRESHSVSFRNLFEDGFIVAFNGFESLIPLARKSGCEIFRLKE